MEKPRKFSFRQLFEQISPVLISPKSSSITISLSKRFLIFQILERLTKRIEDEPYLNFISLLKNYKVLGRILTGTVREFHRDRNKYYFRNFFVEKEVWELVKEDLEWLTHENNNTENIKMALTKRGVIVYDNYKKNSFNLLLMTIHSGTWVPQNIQKKMHITPEHRYREEDVATNKLYSRLVLEKGGIWIDSKQSRFACDFNRALSRSIYQDGSEKWRVVKKLWKESLTEREMNQLYESYNHFYFTLANLVDTYNFNIIFDAHSMKPGKGRANVSFGVEHTPKFYMPIVLYMRKKLKQLGHENVGLNEPYGGGYILRWLKNRYPETFIFSAEINKTLYMTKDRKKIIKSKVDKLSKDINQIFDIEIELENLEE